MVIGVRTSQPVQSHRDLAEQERVLADRRHKVLYTVMQMNGSRGLQEDLAKRRLFIGALPGMGEENQRENDCLTLHAADLLPVCAPRLAAPLKRASDLRGPALLRVAHSPDDWPSWLKASGVARVTARGPEFQYYGQALQAAVDGLGLAMGIRPYIDDDLSAGRLVAPFALSVPKGMRWYLVYRSFRTDQRDFAAFRRWIIRAVAEPAARGRAAGRVQRHAG